MQSSEASDADKNTMSQILRPRTTYRHVCRGTGKKSVAGVSVRKLQYTAAELVAAAAMFCGGTGEVEPPNEKEDSFPDPFAGSQRRAANEEMPQRARSYL